MGGSSTHRMRMTMLRKHMEVACMYACMHACLPTGPSSGLKLLRHVQELRDCNWTSEDNKPVQGNRVLL